MPEPHPAMSKQLRADLEESRWVHRPMPIHWERTKNALCDKKTVLAVRRLHDMASLSGWEAVTQWAKLEVSERRAKAPNSRSIRFSAPCKLPYWTGKTGRIYCVPKAFLHIDHENWEGYNRLSAWVYPDMPGHRTACIRLQLHNEGTHPVPDAFDREGGHNMNLTPGQWNLVRFEIPYVARDDVTGVSFDYDMVGCEPCAQSGYEMYIGDLLLEQVETPEPYEGWEPPPGVIAYSHEGYQPGGQKTAIAAAACEDSDFTLEDESGRTVYTGSVRRVETETGRFAVLDFSAFRREGRYVLRYGLLSTEPFAVAETVWMASAWKTLNFVFCQRCGFRVPGRHDVCHADKRVTHNGMEISGDGGWHDAADTNQQFQLTAEAVDAFFELAQTLKTADPLLAERLTEEGIWGLQYLLKGRFGDGWRVGPVSSANWTDGIRGTCDDVTFEAVNAPFVNLMGALAEARAAAALRQEDEALSLWALRAAREDYRFACEVMLRPDYDFNRQYPGHDKCVSQMLMMSIAAAAATALYRETHSEAYARDAAAFGDEVTACQQREYISGFSKPLTGWFCRDSDLKTPAHYNHRSYEDKTAVALAGICREFPDHPHWGRWFSALIYYKDYLLGTMGATAPFGMIPSGVYSTGEIDDRETFALMHNVYAMFAGKSEEEQRAETFLHYADQLKQGVRLNETYYLRRFPVWYSFRGNYHVSLSQGKGLSALSVYLHDRELSDLAQEQLMWIIGKNPFGESNMFGAGHNYFTQYAVLHGDAVGEVPVGIQSNEERDAPFWPQAANATYKEVWMGPPGKWLAILADQYCHGCLTGTLPAGEYRLTDEAGGTETLHLSGAPFRIALPTGRYLLEGGAGRRSVTVVPGAESRVSWPLADQEITASSQGRDVTLTLVGEGEAALYTDNLSCGVRTVSLHGRRTVPARVLHPERPWCAAMRMNGEICYVRDHREVEV